MDAPEDSLIFAKSIEKINQRGERFNAVEFRAIENTWRTKTAEKTPSIPRGDLLAYLNPISAEKKEEINATQNGHTSEIDKGKPKKRVL